MFKSKAQRRKFYALKAEGKMTQKTIDEFEADTPDDIPERVKTASLFSESYDEGVSLCLNELNGRKNR